MHFSVTSMSQDFFPVLPSKLTFATWLAHADLTSSSRGIRPIRSDYLIKYCALTKPIRSEIALDTAGPVGSKPLSADSPAPNPHAFQLEAIGGARQHGVEQFHPVLGLIRLIHLPRKWLESGANPYTNLSCFSEVLGYRVRR